MSDVICRHCPYMQMLGRAIAEKIDYSESQTRERVRASLLKLVMLSDQLVFPDMVH